MDLVKQAAAIRFERPMDSAGREFLAAIARSVVADREIALDQKDLFPIVVHKRLGREYARSKPQQAGAAAAALRLVEAARQDLLLDAGGVARRCRPPRAHVDTMEFEMGLVDGHWPTLLLLLSAGVTAW